MLFHLFFHLALPICVLAYALSFVSFVVPSITHALSLFFFSDKGFLVEFSLGMTTPLQSQDIRT